MSEDFVDTSVGRLFVESDGDGPPALLWHSLFIDSTSWERLRPALARQRRLIIADGPGHGRSGHPDGEYSIADCAAAALEVLDAQGVSGPVDWVGNAWGGHIGITFAATYPDRCRTLVAIGTPVQSLTRSERLKQIYPLLAGYRIAGPIGFLRKPLFDALFGAEAIAAQPGLAARLVKSFRSADHTGMSQAILSVSLRRPDLTHLLPDVEAPTLMAACQDDPGWTTTRRRPRSRKWRTDEHSRSAAPGTSRRCCSNRICSYARSPRSGVERRQGAPCETDARVEFRAMAQQIQLSCPLLECGQLSAVRDARDQPSVIGHQCPNRG